MGFSTLGDMSQLFRNLRSSLSERKHPPVVYLDDGQNLTATAQGLVITTTPSHTSDKTSTHTVPWWQIQTIRWVAELSLLSVTWTDPGRERLTGIVSAGPPRAFMLAANEFLRSSMVTFRTAKADNGTTITVQVRRNESGELLSILSVDGALDARGEDLANSLERSVREAVGLDF